MSRHSGVTLKVGRATKTARNRLRCVPPAHLNLPYIIAIFHALLNKSTEDDIRRGKSTAASSIEQTNSECAGEKAGATLGDDVASIQGHLLVEPCLQKEIDTINGRVREAVQELRDSTEQLLRVCAGDMIRWRDRATCLEAHIAKLGHPLPPLPDNSCKPPPLLDESFFDSPPSSSSSSSSSSSLLSSSALRRQQQSTIDIERTGGADSTKRREDLSTDTKNHLVDEIVRSNFTEDEDHHIPDESSNEGSDHDSMATNSSAIGSPTAAESKQDRQSNLAETTTKPNPKCSADHLDDSKMVGSLGNQFLGEEAMSPLQGRELDDRQTQQGAYPATFSPSTLQLSGEKAEEGPPHAIEDQTLLLGKSSLRKAVHHNNRGALEPSDPQAGYMFRATRAQRELSAGNEREVGKDPVLQLYVEHPHASGKRKVTTAAADTYDARSPTERNGHEQHTRVANGLEEEVDRQPSIPSGACGETKRELLFTGNRRGHEREPRSPPLLSGTAATTDRRHCHPREESGSVSNADDPTPLCSCSTPLLCLKATRPHMARVLAALLGENNAAALPGLMHNATLRSSRNPFHGVATTRSPARLYNFSPVVQALLGESDKPPSFESCLLPKVAARYEGVSGKGEMGLGRTRVEVDHAAVETQAGRARSGKAGSSEMPAPREKASETRHAPCDAGPTSTGEPMPCTSRPPKKARAVYLSSAGGKPLRACKAESPLFRMWLEERYRRTEAPHD